MKNLLLNSKQTGASLIEVILYVALFSIIIIFVIDLLMTTGSLKTESESQSGLQTDAAFISSRLTYEVRNADTISIPTVVGQTTTSLVLIRSSEAHSFGLTGNNLHFQKTIGATTTVNNLNSSLTSVSNLSFQSLGFLGGKISIKISFTLTELKDTKQGNLTKNYQVIAITR